MTFGFSAKGSRTERELIALFAEQGFSVVRAAGSGVAGECPDLLAFKMGRQFAFESKAWDRTSLQIDKPQFLALKKWMENTGITTMVAWRVSREGWYFLHLAEFNENEKSFSITLERAKLVDRRIGELLK
jgi:Holliday junction resolvase